MAGGGGDEGVGFGRLGLDFLFRDDEFAVGQDAVAGGNAVCFAQCVDGNIVVVGDGLEGFAFLDKVEL